MKTTDTAEMRMDEIKSPRRKRRGYSIVEIGLVLIVVALLIAAIIVAFYQVQTNAKQNQMTNLVNEVYSSVQDLHRSSSSYGTGTDIVRLLEAAESIPAIGRQDPNGVANSGDEIINTAFNNRITVVGNNQTFFLTIVGLTRANCVDFMSNYVDRTLEQSGLVSARVGATAMTIPATVASVTTQCATGDLRLEFR